MSQRTPAATQFGLEIVMRVVHAHRRELLQTLDGFQAEVAREGGVIACEVLEDTLIPNRFCWIERWPGEEQIDSSLASRRFATLMAAVHLLGSVEAVRRCRVQNVPANQPAKGTEEES